MCARYRLARNRQREIEEDYGIDEIDDLSICQRQFNIPPCEMAPIILQDKGRRRLLAGFWSLLSPRTETLGDARKVSTFNARAETLLQKPTYRNVFPSRRCIVPAEAFYEWVGTRGRKQPLHISRRDKAFLSMAGLFSFWRPSRSQGRPLPTFTIVTMEPNRWMARIHDRMPVLLPPNAVGTWLNPGTPVPALTRLLNAPVPENLLDCYPVDSNLLNSGLIDTPQCVENTGADYGSLLRQESQPRHRQMPLPFPNPDRRRAKQ